MQRHKLTALKVKAAGDGKLQDGAGLILVKKGDSGKWVYRYTHLGRRRDMGLGQWPQLSLAEARAARDRWQAVLAGGRDPMDAREEEKSKATADLEKNAITFVQLMQLVFEARKGMLRGQGERGRWLSPLRTHVVPAIGSKRVAQITRHDIARAIKPIWTDHHPTAQKALRRVRMVLNKGKRMGYPSEPFEAEMAAEILGEVIHVAKRIPSTRWQDIPELYARLGTGSADQCLRFMMLTLVRADGCTKALKSEINGDVWIVPEERVKGTAKNVSSFRVPLSPEAMQVVEQQMQLPGPFLFPSVKSGSVNARTIERLMNRLKEPGRPHGLRASFKTWCQDNETCSWDVSETVLGHQIGTPVQRSYARADLLDRRRLVLNSWADFVTGRASPENVVPIRQRSA